jgi:hypothetical protein
VYKLINKGKPYCKYVARYREMEEGKSYIEIVYCMEKN